jgi:hypothetical protein
MSAFFISCSTLSGACAPIGLRRPPGSDDLSAVLERAEELFPHPPLLWTARVYSAYRDPPRPACSSHVRGTILVSFSCRLSASSAAVVDLRSVGSTLATTLTAVHRRALGLLFGVLAAGLAAIAVASALAGGRAWVLALGAAAVALWLADLARRALVRR